MKIAIGCDEIGFEMKEVVKSLLIEKKHEVKDFGTYNSQPVPYPDIGYAVAKSIADGNNERGILVCGTGIGMAIVANKVPGVRAAVCHDPYSAVRSIKSNNVQVMALGARVIGVEVAKYIIGVWLDCNFSGGSSALKLKKIEEYEQKMTGV